MNRFLSSTVFRIFFTLLGFGLLIHIVSSYGMNKFFFELRLSGPALFFLTLSFIPTLFCYSVSWLLATDHNKMKHNYSSRRKLLLFMKMSLTSIAWNNLTPFFKIGGEPLKYLMLKTYLPDKNAFESTINYNIIHLISTGLSFVISFFLVFLFFDFSRDLIIYTIIFFVFIVLTVFVLFWSFKQDVILMAFVFRYKFVRTFIVNLRLSSRKFKILFMKKTKVVLFSLSFDICARFLEGLTFYFGFILIKHPVGLLSSSLLDIGRTMGDTIFFFIPYQIGAREAGIRFYMEKILMIQSTGFVTVVMFYRLVELIWVIVGYILWLTSSKSLRDFRV